MILDDPVASTFWIYNLFSDDVNTWPGHDRRIRLPEFDEAMHVIHHADPTGFSLSRCMIDLTTSFDRL